MANVKSQAKEQWDLFVGGDEAAFRRLYDLTYDELYRYAHRMTGQSATIRDALQEMYLAIWRRRNELPPIREPWVFLLTTLRNKIIDEARRQKRAVIEVEYAAAPSPEDDLLAVETLREQAEWLAKKLGELPERQREALHLRYRVELEYPDIAAVMGVGQQVAYNYVNRGIKNLRKMVSG